jgi:hypothetical protein
LVTRPTAIANAKGIEHLYRRNAVFARLWALISKRMLFMTTSTRHDQVEILAKKATSAESLVTSRPREAVLKSKPLLAHCFFGNAVVHEFVVE